jgi:hypothetical protein
MSTERRYDEERLAELIRMLPPAPDAWVRAAIELPAARRAIDQIVALAGTDAEFRRALLDDLERAVRTAGFEPDPAVVRGVRERLAARGEEGDG